MKNFFNIILALVSFGGLIAEPVEGSFLDNLAVLIIFKAVALALFALAMVNLGAIKLNNKNDKDND